MRRRSVFGRACILVAFWTVAAIGASRSLARAQSQQGKSAPPAAETPLTEAQRSDFGAATWVPEDSSLFFSSLRLKEQWKAIAESRAFKKLQILPFVQLALGQIRQHPMYRELLAEAGRNPLLASALEVASDAISNEIFFQADAQLVQFLQALGDLYVSIIIERVLLDEGAPGDPPLPVIVANVLRRQRDFKAPALLLGFRLSKPEAASKLLASLLEKFKNELPGPTELEEVGGGKFHTLKLNGKQLPRELREELHQELGAVNLSLEEIERFKRYVDTQTISLSVGTRGDYLILSLGSSSEHLKKLGQGRSLAESAAFAPVRKRHRAGLISLGYAVPRLTSTSKLSVDDGLATLDRVLANLPEGMLPDGMPARLKEDARSLLNDINRGLSDAAPFLSMSLLNRGIESIQLGAKGVSGLDSSKPISILERAGESPLAAAAGRSLPSIEAYDRIAHWAGVAYRYFEELAVPRIPEEDREEMARFQRLFIPAIQKLHAITRSELLPAIDNCQNLFLLDGGGQVASMIGTGEPLSRPFRYPRPVLALEVRDMAKLTKAFAGYRETLNRFFLEAEKELQFSHFQIPEPVTRPHAGGALYTYKIPHDLGADVEPHAFLGDKLVVLALSPAQSKSVVESAKATRDEIVDLAAASGAVYKIQLPELVKLLMEDIGIVVDETVRRHVLPNAAAGMIRIHLPEIEKALGALRSVSGRVYEEDGLEVHHSWFHVEDIADD